MKLEYDVSVDCGYVRIQGGTIARTFAAPHGINLDYDEHGNLLGVELLGFTAKPDPPSAAVREGERERLAAALEQRVIASVSDWWRGWNKREVSQHQLDGLTMRIRAVLAAPSLAAPGGTGEKAETPHERMKREGW